MAYWKEFLEASPDLARQGQDQIFQYGVGLAFLATVGENGAPRLHPVCPVISGEKLYVLILPKSPKRGDLDRNGYYALQAFPQAKPDSAEFYLTGKAHRIDDPEIYAKVFEDAKHSASPEEILYELEIDRVMHTRWEGFGTPDYHSIHEKWPSA